MKPLATNNGSRRFQLAPAAINYPALQGWASHVLGFVESLTGRVRQFGVTVMTKMLASFFEDESGAAAAEYALILAIVGAGIASAAFYLGGKISTALHDTGDKVATCSSGQGSNC